MHDHSHHHHGNASGYGRAFLIGIGLNTGFVMTEAVFGIQSGSLALLADAGHNASDVLSLVLAYGAARLTSRKPCADYTYGMQSSSILAALANAVLLLVVIGGLAWEALVRLGAPQDVAGGTVMAVAAVGVLINGATALMFMGGQSDLNVRGAFLHMVADAVISAGVVLSGLVILKTGWAWVDPAVSLAVALVIVAGTWGLLKDSLRLALHGVPGHIDPAAVKNRLQALPGVESVHDLHIWAISTTEAALSAHLLMKNGHPGDEFIRNAAHMLDHDFHIGHSTLQIELGDTKAECPLAPESVV